MPKYRPHPAPDDLDPAGLANMSMLRGFGGELSDGVFIKTFIPSTQIHEDLVGKPEDQFMDSAKIQQQLTAAGTEFWAPIHSTAIGPRGPYYVSNLYPASAAQILMSGAQLSGPAIHRIVLSVLEGLFELKRLLRRPHGNLKATNILISSTDSLADANIVLSDPASSERVAIDGSEISDLFEVGNLIHQLVLQRQYKMSDRWPIPDSREWKRFGRDATTWRNLCSRFLNPNSADGAITLERALEVLRQIRPAKPTNLGRWLFGLAAVLLVAGGAYFTLVVLPARHTTPPALTGMTQELDEVLRFRDRYASRKWTPQLQYLDDLKSRVPATPTSSNGSVLAEVHRAKIILDLIEEKWARIQSNQILFDDLGDPVLRSYKGYVDGLLETAQKEPALTSLQFLHGQLELALKNEDWKAIAGFVKSPAMEKVDKAYFIADSPVHKGWDPNFVAHREKLQQWLAEAKSDQYQKLMIKDPRTDWAASAKLETLRKSELPMMRKLRPSTTQPDKLADDYLAKIQQLDKSINDLSPTILEWSRQNEKKISEGLVDVDLEISRLETRIATAIAERKTEVTAAQASAAEAEKRQEEIDSFVQECLNSTIRATTEVEQEWQARNKQWASEIKADPRRYTDDLKSQRNRIRQALLTLDLYFRGLPAKLDLPQSAAPWIAPLTEVLQQLADQKRKDAVASSLAFFRANATHESILDEVKEQCRRDSDGPFKKWSASASELIADFNEIERSLSDGYTLSETSFDHAKTVRDIRAKWFNNELYINDGVQKILKPLSQQIDEAESSDLQRLAKAASDDSNRLGLRLSAWQKLSAAESTWPATATDLKTNETTADALIKAVDAIREENRKAARKTELETTANANWQRFVERATSNDDMRNAMALPRYAMLDTRPLRSTANFNVTLYAMKTALAAKLSDRDVEQQISKMEQAVGLLPDAAKKSPEITQLFNALSNWKEATTKLDLAKIGPMTPRSIGATAVNWQVRIDERTEAVVYTAILPNEISRDPVELAFRKVDVDPTLPPTYVCTVECPVGIFADLTSACGKWRDMAKLMWLYDPRTGDPRGGPRIWEWPRDGRTDRGFQRTRVWLSGNFDHYPLPTLATTDNRSVLRDARGAPAPDLNPSRKQPMQQISPKAARYFAEMIGCRLQSPAEWKAALKQANVDEVLNLRDRTWKLQRDWIATLPNLGPKDAAEAGMFVPAGEAPTGEAWKDSQVHPATTKPAGAVGRPPGDKEFDDGVLWFRDVAPAGLMIFQAFNNLMGNVGEFALGEDGKMYVIGGSALSPPTRALNKEYEVPENGPAGYSDVGFRLAFSAPVRSLAQLKGTVDRQAYMTSAGASTRPAQ